jgi:hypothetical protein
VARCAARLACMVDEWRELLAELPGVLGVQIDLVLRGAEVETQILVGWAALKIVL